MMTSVNVKESTKDRAAADALSPPFYEEFDFEIELDHEGISHLLHFPEESAERDSDWGLRSRTELDQYLSDPDSTDYTKKLKPTAGFAVRRPCASRKAVLARESRLKRKTHVATLEREIQLLKDKNVQLNNEKDKVACRLSNAEAVIGGLRDAVDYLKSVIAKETTVEALLLNIPDTNTVNLKRCNPSNIGNSFKRFKPDLNSSISSNQARPGVCLHRPEACLSLKFCDQCNSS